MSEGSNLSPRRVIVLFNPRAGRAKARALPDELVSRLAAAGFGAEAIPDLGDACGEANRLHVAGELRAIVAAGGDGTIAEVVNRTAPGVPIATLPLGTENLLARHYGIACDVAAVANTIARGHVVDLDVGQATTGAGKRLFLLMASAGLDAEIIRRLHAGRRGNISHWSYIAPILSSAATYRYPVVRVLGAESSANDEVAEGFARWVVAFNLPCYAGMLQFLPEFGRNGTTRANDGRLDLCRFERGGFWHTLYYYVWLLLGRAERIGTRRVDHFARMRLEAADASERIPLQVDGDPCGFLPVEIDVLRGRLRLIAPSDVKDVQIQ